ncbi:MAG: hypothetical protein MUE94_12450 [Verrucomicrobia bacterium]|nr:hypothetical protein [Verrucomicrobiota bacterium]
MKLKAATGMRRGVWNLEIEGRAVVAGREIIRPGVPPEDLMQAFLYRHLVPMEQWMVAVVGRAPPPQSR